MMANSALRSSAIVIFACFFQPSACHLEVNDKIRLTANTTSTCSTSLDQNLLALGNSLPTLYSFMDCVENNHVVRKNMYSSDIYEKLQPSAQQRTDMEIFMASNFFTGLSDGVCPVLPASVGDILQIIEYREDNTDYCMLIEKSASFSRLTYSNRMSYGWPIVVRPKKAADIKLSVHFTSPHAWSDAYSMQSAAQLFVKTGGVSFMTQTRERDALAGSTNCVKGGESDGQTDGANARNELFFNMARGIITWQERQGCAPGNCAFIQWHGTSTKACYDAYISVGSGATSEYSSSSNRAVALKNNFNALSSYKAITPTSTDLCGYFGPRNVMGRVLNGIADEDLCDVGAQPNVYSNKFIHIEPAQPLRTDMAEMANMAAAITHTWSAA